MIRLEGLAVRVGGFHVVDIDFEVPAGGYGLVIGPTGSGKTTLLEAVAGHVPIRSGRILLRGEEVTRLPPERRRVGFVYQHYHLFPHCSVRENIAYGLARAAIPPAEQSSRVEELAGMLGIAHLLDRGVSRLSGGEQQRVALARALAPRPSILLLDEPFAAVDPSTRHALRRELRALHEREGITTLQVTHDFDDALRLGDVVAVLADGRIVQQGPPEQVFRYPNSAFVAQFIGTGNVIAGTVERIDAGAADGMPFAARFTSNGLAFDVVAEREGTMHAVLRPEDIVLSRSPIAGSARNHLTGVITRLERMGPVTQVHLDVGRPLVAAVTSASVDDLGLHIGETVALTFKATAIHLV